MAQDNRKLTFPQFDVVSHFSDHHFLSRNSGRHSSKPRGGKSCVKAISNEWRILQESLPESIFVRVSETRLDLLRAAIVGAAGTPYHDGLFIFDIAVTPIYPLEPPEVHYRSNGHRINPNLYTNGTVCLSLLNTWVGHQNEKWNPKQSTLLQVLLSLQSLVLTEKPYYNEPGSQWRLNEKISEYYSQDVFVLTCKTTLNVIRNPPMNFEPLIKRHFHDRANTILAACEAYVNGRVTVGLYGCDGATPTSFKIRKEFQMNMEVLYPQLVEEFRQIEATVQLAVESLVVIQNSPEIVHKKEGIFKKLIGKIKDVLAFSDD